MNNSILAILAILTTLGGVFYYVNDTTPSQNLGINETAIYDAFNHWKGKHSRLYGSLEEETLRFQIYKSNIIKIAEHNARANAGEFTFVLGANEFSDLSQDEFQSLYLGTVVSKTQNNLKSLPTLNLPTSVDWRTQNGVSAVKNQGQCGSCWAFSAVGALEGLHSIGSGSLVQFSEQQLVDCSQSFGNEGCNGGLMDAAFEYVAANGIETEADYAYRGSDNKCAVNPLKTTFKIGGFVDVPQNVSSQLQAAIAINPVSIAIEADGFWFQFYLGGIFNASCGTNLDHGVLAVGYGVENGKKFWIVKNSWGGSWGEKGYIRIADNGDGPGVCGIMMSASYPTA